MWTSDLVSAIKSDLFDFVNTIQADTQNTIAKVIGENDKTDDDISLRERMLIDLKRSFGTYGTPIEEEYLAEYKKFLRNFSLSTYAGDIATILDEEVDVSRYYAELVPITINPDEFWSRYFFKLMLLLRGGIAPLDDDDDEEDIAWDTGDISPIKESNSSSNINQPETIESLRSENAVLKSQIKALVVRITELESIINNKKDLSNEQINPTYLTTSSNNLLENNLSSGGSLADGSETLIRQEDVILLSNELEISAIEAESMLLKTRGSVQEALKSFLENLDHDAKKQDDIRNESPDFVELTNNPDKYPTDESKNSDLSEEHNKNYNVIEETSKNSDIMEKHNKINDKPRMDDINKIPKKITLDDDDDEEIGWDED